MTPAFEKGLPVQAIPFTVRVAGGDGLIARFGDAVVYTVTNDDHAAAVIAAVAAAARNPHPGAALVDQLGPFAFGPAKAVSFGAVVPSQEGLHVLLRGRVSMHAETRQGARDLSGESDPRWVRQLLSGVLRRVEVRSGRTGLAAIPRTDLRAGVVGGGGFALLAAGTTGPAETVATERISAVPPEPPTELTPRAPKPAAPVQTAAVSTTVGVLSTPDGAVYPLDRSYVIGRAPLSDDAVRNASASPIVLQYDPYVSRVHAYITVDRDGVNVRDALTSAGTFVAAPGATEWTQIGTVPMRLEPGWSMRVGEWIATHRLGE
jgi:hypothetical protein